MKPLKILVLDIETAPVDAYVWGLWDQNIGLDMLKTDWTILSYAAKWLDDKKLIYEDVRGQKDLRNDGSLLACLWELLNEADIVVGHNVRRFDLKKINARMLEHNFFPYSPVRVIDTLTAAKANFAFTSNKLEHLSARLTDAPKSKHKKFPGFELWAECLKDNLQAWKEMEKYNKQDVVATEKLYLMLRPWIENHPNVGVYSDAEKPLCPKCGGDHMVGHKTRFSVKQQGRYTQYQCQDCGGYARGKTTQLTLAKRRSLLVPQ